MGDLVDLSKVRSSKAVAGDEWTALDVIADFNRAFENGEVSPKGIIICWFEETEEGLPQVHFRNSNPNGLVAIGLLNTVMQTINE